jgi:hypothetical protein
MDFDEQLRRTFGTADLESLPPETIRSGIERMLVEFAQEEDGDRRFSLWTLLYMLGAAPDAAQAFEAEDDREAAQDFMDMMAEADED